MVTADHLVRDAMKKAIRGSDVPPHVLDYIAGNGQLLDEIEHALVQAIHPVLRGHELIQTFNTERADLRDCDLQAAAALITVSQLATEHLA